jgi:hypothetical protein
MTQSSPQSPTNPFKLPGKAARQGLALQGKIYFLRVVFCVSTLALMAVNDAICRGQPGDHLWLLIGGLFYPHIGHVLFGRLDISRRRGHVLFVADGMFVGAVIGALGFSLLPSLVLAAISLFNWMVVGGPILVALGLSFLFGGALTTGMSLGNLALSPAVACNAVNWLASILAIGYFLIVARIIHRLVGELRLQQVDFQARSDSASSAKTMAEQALLAILPASAAQQMADKGQVQTAIIQDATLLLLDFSPENRSSPALDDLKDAFHVATMILSRHGIELVKTFGSQIIAVSRKENGPNDAFKAFQEIDNYFKDHRSQATREHTCLSLCGRLHQGTVTMGLVQPERLNLDLLGEAMNELLLLPADSVTPQTPALIVSGVAYHKLNDITDFIPTPSGSSVSGSYAYAPNQAS